ncbi:Tyrosinase ustQ [Colletotrichum aenigma]|uniref:Tyrosinase ustQ n=1 Tax=Colletotrichum aenigma TaxID=1215731 RepID=UPI0018733562|nr:Tyrosinase ustQ [Colletotrichum aenigma]KAF5502368.1 Tyrosinase ustQ [Colletotrichum aenigma]
MRFLACLWPYALFGALVQSLQCAEPLVRKEWRSLSIEERSNYIAAVKCLQAKEPTSSKDTLPGATNRFEDFVGDHILQTVTQHFTGTFLAWHRLFLSEYEQAIRECGFEGAQPYWDWSLDAEDLGASEVFDPESGFGGNGEWVPGTFEDPEEGIPVTAEGVPVSFDGRTGGGCIPNGPFANMTIHMGPGASTAYYEWCVRRDFMPQFFNESAHSTVIAGLMLLPDFGQLTRQAEISVHGAGHPGVGGLYGTLTDTYSSPGDPLFYLHHTNLDRLWWSWQSRDLSSRLSDISGPIVANDWTNEVDRNVTLDDTVYVGTSNITTRTVKQLMDVREELLCYTYEDLY